MGTRERLLAPKRLQATVHLDLIGCMQTAIGFTPSGNPNPSFLDEISHWCKHSFGHNAQSNATLFPLWSFILTIFFIPFWSLPVSKAEQDFWGAKGKHSRMNYINATELILYRANRSFHIRWNISGWAADLICLMNLFTSCMHPSNLGEGRYMEWELNGLSPIHSSLARCITCMTSIAGASRYFPVI